jgi:uncharacterized protein YeaO (DUF488 family)
MQAGAARGAEGVPSIADIMRRKVVRSPLNFVPLMEDAMGAPVTELDIRLKRAYQSAEEGHGTRVLIDRLWPRGVTKAEAAIDHWFRDLGPSTELRKWFGHDPALFVEFRRRYTAELERQGGLLDELLRIASHGRLTLVYSAHDEKHNDAVVVKGVLLNRAQAEG